MTRATNCNDMVPRRLCRPAASLPPGADLADQPATRTPSTMTTKITPWITSTSWPTKARYSCMAMTTKAPITGPMMVPRPPISAISTTSPEVPALTSVSVAKCTTIALVAPARPATAADSTKASSL